MTTAEQLQKRRSHIAYNKLRTALDIIHSHIAALMRDRSGNPNISNKMQVINDYQTLSALIASIGTYQSPSNPLRTISTYQPEITYYRNETKLERSQKFAIEQIKEAIRELRNIGQQHDVFQHISKTITLLSRDFNSYETSAELRASLSNFPHPNPNPRKRSKRKLPKKTVAQIAPSQKHITDFFKQKKDEDDNDNRPDKRSRPTPALTK
jgi:hypothetical protein